MQSKSSQYQTLKLLTINIAFISLWLVTLLNPERLKALWFVVVLSLALLFIIKNKNTSKHDIFAGVALGCLAMPSHAVMGTCSIVAYIGGASVFKKSKNKILLFKAANIKEILKTVGIAAIAGVALAVINILLAKSAMEFNISIEPEWFLRAIKAGVSEEIIFRFFFFALSVYCIKDGALSGFDNFLCYVTMVLPHVLIHFDATNFTLSSVVVLTLLFGLPFAIMQRKRDLSSAIGAHALVDAVRFCTFGT